MKCINKRSLSMLLIAALIFGAISGGCKKEEADTGTYRLYETSYQYGLLHSATLAESPLFASDLCIPEDENINVEELDTSGVKACGMFNGTTKETLYARDIYHKIYPASTTKIMTAYIALKYGDPDLKVTVSENALDIDPKSSVAGLKVGDQISIRQLLYGLMLVSGNDAAVAIAEGVGGSVESFVSLMNTEANALGATNTHYVNSNGLPSEDHYTTVYDMYLILNAASQMEAFTDIIKTTSYNASYESSSGATVTKTWNNTNRYLDGRAKAPANVSIIGGKTGTTGQAGYCLCLLSRNENNELILSFVFGAGSAGDLYYYMNNLLTKFA